MVHKPGPSRMFMERAPWRLFYAKDKEVLVDVDGGITIDGHTATPFPCEITHAAICDDGLVATWVDHELRLARMALLSLDEKLLDGPSKSELRANRDTSMVAGADWCHIVDAEPLGLVATGDKIIFGLWSRGIYCIDSEANEIWRTTLFEVKEKSPPRSDEVAAISISGQNAVVWSRNGAYRTISIEDGSVLDEKSIGIDCDLEHVFNHENNFLISSSDGWAWEMQGDEITLARKFRGTIQDAAYDGNDWRVISWREDSMLRGKSQERVELGVQIIKDDDLWQVLDNQGKRTPHMGAN